MADETTKQCDCKAGSACQNPACAQKGADKAAPASAYPKINPQDLPADSSNVTRGTWKGANGSIDYRATVGTIAIDTPKVKPACSVFYLAFEAVDKDGKADANRPVTFIFNGGPGSSSTYLMLGSFGPQRIGFADTKEGHGAPYELVENNEYCMLPFSDVVFIDAPGAGFSKIADKARAELWSVDGDVAGFSQFIQRWCLKNGRWNSPKYVFGESYGTVRGSLLTLKMEQDGIALTGATLISNILDYAYTFDMNDQLYIGYMPTFAMTSQYHGKAGAGESVEEHAQKAREFAEKYRVALARGNKLDDATKSAVAKKYAELTGLPQDYIENSDLRVPDSRYRKQVLRSGSKIVGRYDGRVSGFDMDPEAASETFVVDDAFQNPGYVAMGYDYLCNRLGWKTEDLRADFAPFDWTSCEPGKGWVWTHQSPDGLKGDDWGYRPFPNTLGDLAAAIVHEPKLKVLICNGYYDMATPFFQTEFDVDHLELPEALRANVAMTYYESGHMIYTAPKAMGKLYADLEKFYASDHDLSSIDERPALPSLKLD